MITGAGGDHTHGALGFDNASLRDVAATLERWYGLTVTVPPSLAGRRVTLSTPSTSADRTLAAIALLLDARVTRHGDSVSFTPTSP